MLKEAVGRGGIDFPLADFLSEAPNKTFLTGVTSGRVVNTVTIDGAPCDHLFFPQPPGIELELWLPKDEPAVPRRLIVTYRAVSGEPNSIAEFPDWNFNIHPSYTEFTFQPPSDAAQVAFNPPSLAATRTANKTKGGKNEAAYSSFLDCALTAWTALRPSAGVTTAAASTAATAPMAAPFRTAMGREARPAFAAALPRAEGGHGAGLAFAPARLRVAAARGRRTELTAAPMAGITAPITVAPMGTMAAIMAAPPL